MSHEPLLTSVVGSHARPSWFVAGIDAAERGEFGPIDLDEMLDDGVDLALRDQEEAGIDIVSDGEMRRAGFFTRASTVKSDGSTFIGSSDSRVSTFCSATTSFL